MKAGHKFLVGAGIIVVSVALLIAQGVRETGVYFLTPTELAVLRMIARGLSRVEIAQAMHRSPKTVDNHRAAMMEKLGIHSRVELARFAIREGLAEA